MKESHITDPNSKSSFTIWQNDDFEKINPVELYKEIYIKISMSLAKSELLFELKKRNIPIVSEAMYKADDYSLDMSLKEWEKKYDEYLAKRTPNRLFEVLESNSKNEQIKALKGISLSADELTSFIMKAYLNYGYTLSQYTSTHFHTGLNKAELPPFILKREDDKITSIGNTKLTEGQLKQTIDQRRVIISKFLDKGDKWHCFFLSYRSLKGEETAHKNGQSHLHFISHTWGLSREYVLEQLKSKHYKLPTLPHIDFTMSTT